MVVTVRNPKWQSGRDQFEIKIVEMLLSAALVETRSTVPKHQERDLSILRLAGCQREVASVFG